MSVCTSGVYLNQDTREGTKTKPFWLSASVDTS
jgi:hypothetical protein